ncbi:MAG: T9SS type A sorting domain-containing protein [Bacteroidota bacterium]
MLPTEVVQAQTALAGRDAFDFRLNLLRTEVLTPHGQQPPYEWSAPYLRDVSSNVQPTAVFRLDSSVCGKGVVNTSQFGQEIKIQYHYDSQGQLNEIIFFRENSSATYDPYSRKSYSYQDGLRTNYLYQLWDQSSSSWQDDYEEMTTYNSSSKQESFMIREANSSGQWMNLFRENRAYDSMGRVRGVLSAKWDNNVWLDTARKEIEYNENGLYSMIYEQAWNGTAWDTLSRESAFYDELGMIWEGYLFENKTQNAFEEVVREQYQYDTYGYWTGMNRQIWNGGEWENAIKETYRYNRTGLWLGWTQEIFKDSAWVNDIRQFYQKDGSNRNDLMQEWDTVAGEWNDRFRSVTRFDSDKNLIIEAGIQAWDEQAVTWGNLEKSRMCEHFWSPISATALGPQLPDLHCTLTNPYRVYEPIYCESLQAGKQYDVRLMDMQGRTVYERNISGGEIFSVDRSLPIGVYQLGIYDKQQIRFVRKIVINP